MPSYGSIPISEGSIVTWPLSLGDKTDKLRTSHLISQLPTLSLTVWRTPKGLNRVMHESRFSYSAAVLDLVYRSYLFINFFLVTSWVGLHGVLQVMSMPSSAGSYQYGPNHPRLPAPCFQPDSLLLLEQSNNATCEAYLLVHTDTASPTYKESEWWAICQWLDNIIYTE